MMRRILCTLLISLAFAGCGTTATGLDEDQPTRSRYAGREGQSPVGIIPDGVLRDDARGKDLVMTIEYPTRVASSPLIVFSHAYASSNRDYIGLSSFWASQGYVVIKPAHADAARTLRGLDDQWTSQTPEDWRNRVRDITFILDNLDRLEQAYPELQGKIDRTKIGVAGHSYGAFTAQLVAGVRTYPGATSYADPRVKALVVMAPTGAAENRGLTNESWANLRIPAMFMTGTADQGAAATETPEWRRQAYEYSPAGDKWLVVVSGARHGSFTGRTSAMQPTLTPNQPTFADPQRDPERTRGSDPQLPSGSDPRRTGSESPSALRERGTFDDIKAVSLMFWDRYLLATDEGRNALENADARGGIEVVRK
jgi:predicted dienelactone hydrolase